MPNVVMSLLGCLTFALLSHLYPRVDVCVLNIQTDDRTPRSSWSRRNQATRLHANGVLTSASESAWRDTKAAVAYSILALGSKQPTDVWQILATCNNKGGLWPATWQLKISLVKVLPQADECLQFRSLPCSIHNGSHTQERLGFSDLVSQGGSISSCAAW